MGISLLHDVLTVGLVLALMRTIAVWVLANNPDSRLGKFLVYAY